MFKPAVIMGQITREIRYLRALLQDPRTPTAAKCFIGSGLAYLLSPIDLIPDILPLIGQLDDLLVVPTLVYLGLRLVPDVVKRSNRSRTRSIEATGCLEEPSANFKTAALPGSFGVLVIDVDDAAGHPSELLLSLVELVIEHQVVVSRAAIWSRLLDPLRVSFSRLPLETPTGSKTLNVGLGGQFSLETVSGADLLEFVDLTSAYEGLSDDDQRLAGNLQVRTGISEVASSLLNAPDIWSLKQSAPLKAGVARPLVFRHPVTDRKTLLPLQSSSEIVGLTAERSRELVNELMVHQQKKWFRSEHQPHDGDVVARDTFSTIMVKPRGMDLKA